MAYFRRLITCATGYFSVLFFLSTSVFSQADTTYFDKEWKQIKDPPHAEYFRIMKQEDGTWKVRDYYKKTGKRQMDGRYSNTHPLIREGKFTWYRTNGDAFKQIEYVHGDKKTVYFYTNNLLTEKQVIVNNNSYWVYIYETPQSVPDSFLRINNRDYMIEKEDTILVDHLFINSFIKGSKGESCLALKWKFFPWMLIGTGINYTLGAEYIFSNQSIEFTGSYGDYSMPAEDNQGNSLPRTYTVMRNLQLSYRKYSGNIGRNKYYVSCFMRYSHWQDFYQQGAVTTFLKNEDDDICVGITGGVLMWNDGRRYLDFFVGPMYRFRSVSEVQKINNVIVNNDFFVSGPNIRIGFNFSFLVGRGKKVVAGGSGSKR